jgi:hypothetical protein
MVLMALSPYLRLLAGYLVTGICGISGTRLPPRHVLSMLRFIATDRAIGPFFSYAA